MGEISQMVEAAARALYSDDDPATCIERCDQALGGPEALSPQESLVLTLLKAEAELSAGLDSFASRTLGGIDHTKLDDPRALTELGQLWLALLEVDHAGDCFGRALKLDDSLADAHYGMAHVASAEEDDEQMLAHLLRTLELDLAEPVVGELMTDDELRGVVERAVDVLPDELEDILRAVPWNFADAPSRELVQQGEDPRAPIVLEADDSGEAVALHAFRRPIAALGGEPDELVDLLAAAIMGEIALASGEELA